MAKVAQSTSAPENSLARIKYHLRRLYEGRDSASKKFRYTLLAFDILMLAYLFVSSFYYGTQVVEILDVLLGLFICGDVLARLWLSNHKWSFVFSVYGIADIITAISLLLPVLGENMAFLRVIRTLRLFRSFAVLDHLRRDFVFFRRHEDIIVAAINLLIFIFVMTAIVFESQIGRNDHIHNYIDALYFTVTTLTTTGFGDITLTGNSGKLIAVLIMIFGVSLFIRLIQIVFRSHKVRHKCPDCGLLRHDRDAVHCKHCGRMLDIENEGIG